MLPPSLLVLALTLLGLLSRGIGAKPIESHDTLVDVVSKALGGSDKDKAEAVSMVLELLAEIDLSSLCQSINANPARSARADDVFARAIAERKHVTPSPSGIGQQERKLGRQSHTNDVGPLARDGQAPAELPKSSFYPDLYNRKESNIIANKLSDINTNNNMNLDNIDKDHFNMNMNNMMNHENNLPTSNNNNNNNVNIQNNGNGNADPFYDVSYSTDHFQKANHDTPYSAPLPTDLEALVHNYNHFMSKYHPLPQEYQDYNNVVFPGNENYNFYDINENLVYDLARAAMQADQTDGNRDNKLSHILAEDIRQFVDVSRLPFEGKDNDLFDGKVDASAFLFPGGLMAFPGLTKEENEYLNDVIIRGSESLKPDTQLRSENLKRENFHAEDQKSTTDEEMHILAQNNETFVLHDEGFAFADRDNALSSNDTSSSVLTSGTTTVTFTPMTSSAILTELEGNVTSGTSSNFSSSSSTVSISKSFDSEYLEVDSEQKADKISDNTSLSTTTVFERIGEEMASNDTTSLNDSIVLSSSVEAENALDNLVGQHLQMSSTARPNADGSFNFSNTADTNFVENNKTGGDDSEDGVRAEGSSGAEAEAAVAAADTDSLINSVAAFDKERPIDDATAEKTSTSDDASTTRTQMLSSSSSSSSFSSSLPTTATPTTATETAEYEYSDNNEVENQTAASSANSTYEQRTEEISEDYEEENSTETVYHDETQLNATDLPHKENATFTEQKQKVTDSMQGEHPNTLGEEIASHSLETSSDLPTPSSLWLTSSLSFMSSSFSSTESSFSSTESPSSSVSTTTSDNRTTLSSDFGEVEEDAVVDNNETYPVYADDSNATDDAVSSIKTKTTTVTDESLSPANDTEYNAPAAVIIGEVSIELLKQNNTFLDTTETNEEGRKKEEDNENHKQDKKEGLHRSEVHYSATNDNSSTNSSTTEDEFSQKTLVEIISEENDRSSENAIVERVLTYETEANNTEVRLNFENVAFSKFPGATETSSAQPTATTSISTTTSSTTITTTTSTAPQTKGQARTTKPATNKPKESGKDYSKTNGEKSADSHPKADVYDRRSEIISPYSKMESASLRKLNKGYSENRGEEYNAYFDKYAKNEEDFDAHYQPEQQWWRPKDRTNHHHEELVKSAGVTTSSKDNEVFLNVYSPWSGKEIEDKWSKAKKTVSSITAAAAKDGPSHMKNPASVRSALKKENIEDDKKATSVARPIWQRRKTLKDYQDYFKDYKVVDLTNTLKWPEVFRRAKDITFKNKDAETKAKESKNADKTTEVNTNETELNYKYQNNENELINKYKTEPKAKGLTLMRAQASMKDMKHNNEVQSQFIPYVDTHNYLNNPVPFKAKGDFLNKNVYSYSTNDDSEKKTLTVFVGKDQAEELVREDATEKKTQTSLTDKSTPSTAADGASETIAQQHPVYSYRPYPNEEPKVGSPHNPKMVVPNLGTLWGLNPDPRSRRPDLSTFWKLQQQNLQKKLRGLSVGSKLMNLPSAETNLASSSTHQDGRASLEEKKVQDAFELPGDLDLQQKTLWSEASTKASQRGYSCPGLFGYFGDALDCHSFFICSWGVPYRFYCPSGLMWNPEESVCDWARNVKCTNPNSQR